MTISKNIFKKVTSVRKFRIRTVAFIALLWTLTDITVVLLFNNLPAFNKLSALLLRESIVFISSLIMGYLLVVELRRLLRHFNLLTTIFLKSLILIVAAFLINLILYAINSVSILGSPIAESFHHFYNDYSDIKRLMQKLLYWLILFLVTQLLFELNEKYSPGVFWDILLGKYAKPKIERRIIMFIDLKDSTPIAEKLSSQQYFRFISEFIYFVSEALIEYGGRIYQYVGDEIVVSWQHKDGNSKKSILALIKARRNLNKQQHHFMRRFGFVPEFRAGIHVGEVTVGEIGVIKKDLAMSGDTMNTTARIRSACTELNSNIIMSKDFLNDVNLRDGQSQNLGKVELKGKTKEMELYALNI
ncbi:MAG: adenylate/guanylate cyclase domain-containing protein [Parafilimonas sp.]|nr:adenylate/guanylate cyclase domain-containing protein [Parafilimonas sp.]